MMNEKITYEVIYDELGDGGALGEVEYVEACNALEAATMVASDGGVSIVEVKAVKPTRILIDITGGGVSQIISDRHGVEVVLISSDSEDRRIELEGREIADQQLIPDADFDLYPAEQLAEPWVYREAPATDVKPELVLRYFNFTQDEDARQAFNGEVNKVSKLEG